MLFKFWCSSYRDRDNADNMKPYHVIRKFRKKCLWLPLVTSILTSTKNDRSNFERGHWELSIAVSRGLLGRLVFEIAGGSYWPPPWLRPPQGPISPSEYILFRWRRYLFTFGILLHTYSVSPNWVLGWSDFAFLFWMQAGCCSKVVTWHADYGEHKKSNFSKKKVDRQQLLRFSFLAKIHYCRLLWSNDEGKL